MHDAGKPPSQVWETTNRTLEEFNSSIGVIIRDSHGTAIAALNKVLPAPTQQK